FHVISSLFFLLLRLLPRSTLFPYTTLFRSTHYEMGGRTGGLGSSNTVVANNIFMNGGNMASISSSGPYTGSWTNNIRWNTKMLRSEEHTSELQSRSDLVCRLLLEKKKKDNN